MRPRCSKRAMPTLLSIVVLLLAACTGPTPAATPGPIATGTPLPPTPQPTDTTMAAPTPPLATLTPLPAPKSTETATSLPDPTPPAQTGGDSIGDPKAPELGNTGYDVLRYTLALAIDLEAQTISGTATIEAAATLPNLGRLSLDFSGPEISRLMVDGMEAGFQRQGMKLVVDLPRLLNEGQAFTIVVAYSGHPQQIQSRYVDFFWPGLYFVDDMAFALSEPDGARSWFPCNDHPRDKALFRYEITVPKGYVVAANGQPEPPVEGETTTTFVWEHGSPMATYLATVAVGRYHVIEDTASSGVPLRHYVSDDLVPAAETLLASTGDMIAFLEGYFGPYPFESYGHVVVPTGGVSLEAQTMTLLDAGVVSFGLETIVVHELAHQWFGDSVSPASWADIWLNEGFAVYASWLWEEVQSPDLLALQLNATEESAWQADPGEPLADPSAGNLFGFNSYNKGAWVLRMLRGEIGDRDFFKALRTYHHRFKGSVASTADFQSVVEEVSGQDLGWFFDQWVYGRHIPNLTVNWQQGTDGSLQVQVCQHPANPFVFDLRLAVLGDGAQRAGQTLEVDEIEEQLTLPIDFAVTEVQTDPDQAVLAEVTVSQVEAFSPCR
jgi:aminopeptidase N